MARTEMVLFLQSTFPRLSGRAAKSSYQYPKEVQKRIKKRKGWIHRQIEPVKGGADHVSTKHAFIATYGDSRRSPFLPPFLSPFAFHIPHPHIHAPLYIHIHFECTHTDILLHGHSGQLGEPSLIHISCFRNNLSIPDERTTYTIQAMFTLGTSICQ